MDFFNVVVRIASCTMYIGFSSSTGSVLIIVFKLGPVQGSGFEF